MDKIRKHINKMVKNKIRNLLNRIPRSLTFQNDKVYVPLKPYVCITIPEIQIKHTIPKNILWGKRIGFHVLEQPIVSTTVNHEIYCDWIKLFDEIQNEKLCLYEIKEPDCY